VTSQAPPGRRRRPGSSRKRPEPLQVSAHAGDDPLHAMIAPPAHHGWMNGNRKDWALTLAHGHGAIQAAHPLSAWKNAEVARALRLGVSKNRGFWMHGNFGGQLSTEFANFPVDFRCGFVDFGCKKPESGRVFPWHLDAEH